MLRCETRLDSLERDHAAIRLKLKAEGSAYSYYEEIKAPFISFLCNHRGCDKEELQHLIRFIVTLVKKDIFKSCIKS